MKSKFLSFTLILILVCSFATHSGCDSNGEVKEIYSTNIKKLHLCYVMYLEKHEYEGPQNEAEFKDYLKNDPTAIFLLKRIDVTPEMVDEIFVSDRDGQPFEIRYGVKGEADHAVIFESVGVEGTRLIALTKPIEVDDEDEYQDYLTGKIEPEAAPGGGGMSEDSNEAAQKSEVEE